MKRFFVVIFVLLFVLISVVSVKHTQNVVATSSAKASGYAQVNTNSCYLFENADKNSPIFLLEQSYFVKVLEDYSNLFFKVKYLDFEGFVEKSSLNFVEEYPETPFLTGITFDINTTGNVCLRTSPKTFANDENILCTIPSGTKNITYYGKISGEESMLGLGNIWFYCAYEDVLGNIYKGYIYSPLTNNLSSIASSDESVTFVNVNNFVPVDSILYLNLTTKNLLILITAIPTLVVLLLFVLPSKLKQKE